MLDYGMIAWVLRQQPVPVLGFILIGASAVLAFHLHRKLQGVGEKNLNHLITIPNTAFWTLPRAYLRVRSTYGWSTWPAYAVWFCMLLGIVLLVAGLPR